MTTQISELDRQIAAARARAEARKANAGTAPVTSTKGNVTDKLQREAQVKAAKEAKKAEREVKKAQRLAQQSGKVPHMAKLLKAQGKLPQLSEEIQEEYDLVKDKDLSDLSRLVAWLQYTLRERSTVKSAGISWGVGDVVRIIAAGEKGAQEFIGSLAVVQESKKIHARVIPVGTDKEVYVFTSDLEAAQVEVSEEVQDSTDDEEVTSSDEISSGTEEDVEETGEGDEYLDSTGTDGE